jgi:hypothetical protein
MYKSRKVTKIVKDLEEHRKLAGEGWLDMWTDESPNQFIDLIKVELAEKKEALKELDKLRKEIEAEENKEVKKVKAAKNGNRKNNTKSGPKAS